MLDFQRFTFLRNSLRILYASFTQCLNSLIFNDLKTSSKRLIFNTFTHLYGAGGWVKGRVLSIVEFLAKVQETAKLLQSHCKENCKATKPYSINGLVSFLFLVLQFCSDKDMYRKNEIFTCKNRAKWVGGLGRIFLCRELQNCKEF